MPPVFQQHLILKVLVLVLQHLVHIAQAAIVVLEARVRVAKQPQTDVDAAQVKHLGVAIPAHVIVVQRGQVANGQAHLEVERPQDVGFDANGTIVHALGVL